MSDPQTLAELRVLALFLASHDPPGSTAQARDLRLHAEALSRAVLKLTEGLNALPIQEDVMSLVKVSTVVSELAAELSVRGVLPRDVVAEWLATLAPIRGVCGARSDSGSVCERETGHLGTIHSSGRLPAQKEG